MNIKTHMYVNLAMALVLAVLFAFNAAQYMQHGGLLSGALALLCASSAYVNIRAFTVCRRALKLKF